MILGKAKNIEEMFAIENNIFFSELSCHYILTLQSFCASSVYRDVIGLISFSETPNIFINTNKIWEHPYNP